MYLVKTHHILGFVAYRLSDISKIDQSISIW